jgi:hypothetical protein
MSTSPEPLMTIEEQMRKGEYQNRFSGTRVKNKTIKKRDKHACIYSS